MPATNEQYVAKLGLFCPYCNSNHIEAGSGEADSGGYFERVHCNDCEKEWHDCYNLVGWEPL